LRRGGISPKSEPQFKNTEVEKPHQNALPDMKLHLGCGQYYLEGYVNIDFPPSEHSVQKSLRADLFRDLTTLSYPRGSVDEIRLHHVFEHFSRPLTLALLCRWRDWLAHGGKLRIETPDLMASAWLLVSPLIGYEDKQQVIRHLFGSHEAHWAIHWDGWYSERFMRTLGRLGFNIESIRKSKWGRLRSIEVLAVKDAAEFSLGEYRIVVEELLALSTVKTKSDQDNARAIPASEREMLRVWMVMWESAYLRDAD
jgi:predicted SAM-dependent methyltransferase